VTFGRDIVDRDGALAVGLLAQRAAVLPLDADGVPALLREGRVVDDEEADGEANASAIRAR
jgi:hypothetical protein